MAARALPATPDPAAGPEAARGRTGLALLAGCLMTGALGSIHAFSVLVAPLEARFAAGRAEVSLTYALALICLTVVVLTGHRFYDLLRPAVLAFLSCALAAAGLLLAAFAPSLLVVYLGYSLLFGAANGLGYGFALVLVRRAMPRRKGFAMGTVTAVYALGAMLFAMLLGRLVPSQGLTAALLALAAAVALAGILAALAIRGAAVPRPESARAESAGAESAGAESAGAVATGGALSRPLLMRLWAGYGLGVFAGLMAIGHAAGIVGAAGGGETLLVAGAVVVGLGNACGGFIAGGLADRWPLRRVLVALPLLSAACLAGLAAVEGPGMTVLGLGLVGFAYGAIIAVYPVAAADYFGPREAARAYGRIFTAWGLAGLGGPWLAGALFERGGGYGLALLCAAAASLLSALVAATLRPPPAAEGI